MVACSFGDMPGAFELGLAAAAFHAKVKAMVASGQLRLAQGSQLSAWRLWQAAAAAAVVARQDDGPQPALCLASSLRMCYQSLADEAAGRQRVMAALQDAMQAPELRRSSYSSLQRLERSRVQQDVQLTSAQMAAVEVKTAMLCKAIIGQLPKHMQRRIAVQVRGACCCIEALLCMHAAHVIVLTACVCMHV